MLNRPLGCCIAAVDELFKLLFARNTPILPPVNVGRIIFKIEIFLLIDTTVVAI